MLAVGIHWSGRGGPVPKLCPCQQLSFHKTCSTKCIHNLDHHHIIRNDVIYHTQIIKVIYFWTLSLKWFLSRLSCRVAEELWVYIKWGDISFPRYNDEGDLYIMSKMMIMMKWEWLFGWCLRCWWWDQESISHWVTSHFLATAHHTNCCALAVSIYFISIP